MGVLASKKNLHVLQDPLQVETVHVCICESSLRNSILEGHPEADARNCSGARCPTACVVALPESLLALLLALPESQLLQLWSSTHRRLTLPRLLLPDDLLLPHRQREH